MFDAISFYERHNIPYRTQGHKHCRKGWVQIECPFCTGNAGFHLGYCLKDGMYVCWRCGYQPIRKVVGFLAGVPENKALDVVFAYQNDIPYAHHFFFTFCRDDTGTMGDD